MRLKELREDAGLSQAKLGMLARVHPATISHVEAGRLYPYPLFRKRIAKVLQMKEWEVFESESEPVKK